MSQQAAVKKRTARRRPAKRRSPRAAKTVSLVQFKAALEPAVATLKNLAAYELEPEVDRFMLDLGERKDSLDQQQHDVLLDLVNFTQRRTVEKFEARVALQRLARLFPEFVDGK